MNLLTVLEVLQHFVGVFKPENELAPESFNNLLGIANLKHFKRKIGLPEEYRPGMPLPSQILDITQKISQDLRPFRFLMGDSTNPPLIVNASGEANIPTNMYYPSSMSFKYIKNAITRIRPVNIVTDSQWDELAGHSIKQPDKRNPIANFQANYIRFLPMDVQFIGFVYYRYPTDPHFAYTSTKGYVEYDATLSVQLEWDDINIVDIISIILFDLGISVGRGDIVQIADKFKKEGV